MNERVGKMFETFKTLEAIYKDKNDILRELLDLARQWVYHRPLRSQITIRSPERTTSIRGSTYRPNEVPIITPGDGYVTEAEWAAYGNIVKIAHLDNIETRYGHLQDMYVKKGQKVKRGDVIGKCRKHRQGNAPHLHFEIIHAGKTRILQTYIISEIMHF
ncbi:MAG: M23 family metallopeptidase [Marinilabiliales bacterium]|nr:M23 family metallopeptidase [Marinilabiliales bacterium]